MEEMAKKALKTKGFKTPSNKIAEGNFVALIGNRQQTTDNRQQTTGNRQQTTDNRQQTTDNRQQTTDNRQQTTDNYTHLLNNRVNTLRVLALLQVNYTLVLFTSFLIVNILILTGKIVFYETVYIALNENNNLRKEK